MADEKVEQTTEESTVEEVEETQEPQEQVEESKPEVKDEKTYTKKDFDKQAYAIRKAKAENKELKAKIFEFDEKLKEFESVKAENVELKAEKQCNEWKKSVSKEFGIPADVLRGHSEEEIRGHAEQLKESGFGKFDTALGDNSHAEPSKDTDSMKGQIADLIRDFKGTN